MQWKPDDDTQVYGFYTRGFRSGGYNTRNNSAVVPPGPTDQEIMDSFELGAKHNLGGGTRLNAAVFRNKLSDLKREVQFATATKNGREAGRGRVCKDGIHQVVAGTYKKNKQ